MNQTSRVPPRSADLFRIATSTPARVIVTAALLAILATTIDREALVASLTGASWGWFAAAVGLLLGAFLVGAVRWHALLVVGGLATSMREALRAYLIGAFSNNLLPTGYGGEAVRAWIVGRSGKRLARSFTSVLVDRASSIACLFLLAWLAVVSHPRDVPSEIVVLLGMGTVLLALGAVAALVISRRTNLGRFLPDGLRPWTAEIAGLIRSYERDRGLIVRLCLLGTAYQLIVVTAFWMISEAVGLGLEPSIIAMVTPTVLILAMMPVSIAGFGVREAAFVVLLGKFGVTPADATLLSLLSVAALAIASAPGGVAILLRAEQAPTSIPELSRPTS